MKKVLRAIGGFFAKIGHWIANTAWVQPLLIVGGIFAIIFSIPYIKRGIEGLIASNQVDTKLAFYTSRAVSLDKADVGTGESRADKLFTWLEEGNEEEIKKEFGEKFFLSFSEKTCDNCKDLVEGFTTFESKFSSEYRLNKDKDTGEELPGFKFYSIMADTFITDSNSSLKDKYPAQVILNRHQSLLEEIVATYTEEKTAQTGYEYCLLNNLESGQEALITSISKLINIESDGIDVPTTFLIDLTDKAPDTANVNGVTAIFFNYKNLMKEDSGNVVHQAEFLRDCWTYSNSFSPDGKEINYYYEGAE